MGTRAQRAQRDKWPAHTNPQAERATLGAFLIDPAQLAAHIGRLIPEDFEDYAHRDIFAAMLALHARGKLADIIAVNDEMQRAGTLTDGGLLISGLVSSCANAGSADTYVGILVRNTVARQRQALGNDLVLERVTAGEAAERLAALDARTAYGASLAPSAPVTQNARELLGKMLPPVRWPVHGLIAEGVTLIAAKPKRGKTTLLLNLSLSIAAGTRALGHLSTQGGTVLYAALEDNERRLQKRLNLMLPLRGPVPERWHVTYAWPRLDHGGLDEVRRWMDAHPDTRLIVFDTLEHIRPARSMAAGVYADDYASVRGLQHLASERQVAIAVIHHLRKAPAADVFDEVNASNGLLASVDNAIILRSNAGIMEVHRRGRDYEDDDVLALRGDPVHLTWTWAGNAEDIVRSEQRTAILTALRAALPDALSPRDLADITGQQYGGVRFLLHRMATDNEVLRVGRGAYTVAVAPQPPPPTPEPPAGPATYEQDTWAADDYLHVAPDTPSPWTKRDARSHAYNAPANIPNTLTMQSQVRNLSGFTASENVSSNVSGLAIANNRANNFGARQPGIQAALLSDVSDVSNVSGRARPVCFVCHKPKIPLPGGGYRLTCDCGKEAGGDDVATE